jgi:hypothetical protein
MISLNFAVIVALILLSIGIPLLEGKRESREGFTIKRRINYAKIFYDNKKLE